MSGPAIPQPLPSGDTTEDAFARELARAIGPALQPADGTVAAAELRADGTGLATVYDDQTTAVGNAFASGATVLLVEWEQRLGIPTDLSLTIAQRQNALVTALRSLLGGTPQRILTAVRTLAPEATLTENSYLTVSEPEGVYRFAVTVSAANWGSDVKRARMLDAIEKTKPAHTQGALVTLVGFLFDDPNSLFDRDAFGV